MLQRSRRLDPDDVISWRPNEYEKAKLAIELSGPGLGKDFIRHFLPANSVANHSFPSAEQVAAYVGLVPVEYQSGTSLHGRPHLSKAGPARIRARLYLAAVVATRYNLHLNTLYERLLARGKAKKAALGAAMRQLVHLRFGVLKNRQPYQADYACST